MVHLASFVRQALFAGCVGTLGSLPAAAQTTAFTYQGKLTDASASAVGTYDLQFRLFDAASGGTQIGGTLVKTVSGLADGIFAVQLDFGACPACFDGNKRYLDIGVRLAGGGAFTLLPSRQEITSNPYAIRSLSAEVADTVTGSFNIRGNGIINGQLGVGTAAPTFKAQVVGIGDPNPTTQLHVAAPGSHPGLKVETEEGTTLRAEAHATGGILASFGGYGRFEIDADGIRAGRLSMLENGFVGLGAFTPQDRLHVEGDVRAKCYKDVSGMPVAGICPSDERLKRNIVPFAPALERIVRLQPVQFDWRADEFPELHLGSARTRGLVAQQVEKVFPEMVSTDPSGLKAVNYSEVSMLLLQAIRELKAENDSLRHELRRLDRRLQAGLAAAATKVAAVPAPVGRPPLAAARR
jgi:hypothetical protein